jgi:hypothetical protein
MAISAQRLPWRPPSTRHPSGVGAQAVYRPRQPAASALYAVVQHHIETFLTHAVESDPVGYGVPTWVEKDFRAYLRCGILAYGFARAHCDACGHERLIALAC